MRRKSELRQQLFYDVLPSRPGFHRSHRQSNPINHTKLMPPGTKGGQSVKIRPVLAPGKPNKSRWRNGKNSVEQKRNPPKSGRVAWNPLLSSCDMEHQPPVAQDTHTHTHTHTHTLTLTQTNSGAFVKSCETDGPARITGLAGHPPPLRSFCRSDSQKVPKKLRFASLRWQLQFQSIWQAMRLASDDPTLICFLDFFFWFFHTPPSFLPPTHLSHHFQFSPILDFDLKKKQNSNQCSVISPGSKKVSNNWGKGEDEEKEDGREEARGKARERKEGRRRPKRTKKKTRLLAAVLADVERRTVECETTETLVDDVHTRTHFRQMTATESSASFSIILFFSSSKKKNHVLLSSVSWKRHRRWNVSNRKTKANVLEVPCNIA